MSDPSQRELESVSILKNASALIGGEIGGRLLAFVAAAYLSRRLGVEGFGLIGFATAFAGYFSLVVRGGVPRLGAREVARSPDTAPALVASLTMIRVGIAAVVFSVLWVIAGALSLGETAQFLVRLSGLSLFSVALDVSWAHKGLGQGSRVAATMIVGQAFSLVALLLFVRTTQDLAWVPISVFGGEILAAAALLLPFVIRTRGWIFAAAFRLMKGATIPAATNLFRVVILTFDIVWLGVLGRLADIGAYTAAYRISFLVVAIAVAVHSSFWPAAALAKSPRALGRVVTRALTVVSSVAFPMIVGGIVVAGPLMQLLFGDGFDVGTPMLRWLLIGSSFTLGHGAFTAALIASGATRLELAIMAMAAAFNVVGNLLVIPAHGALGAAVVTAASEAVALALCLVAGQRAGWRVRGRGILPSMAASAIMGIILLLAGSSVPVLLRILLGGLVYVGALLAFGLPADLLPIATRLGRIVSARRGGRETD